MRPLLSALLLPLLVQLATASDPRAAAVDAYWARLESLCGQAFEGKLVEASERARETFEGKRLVMHVRRCAENEIRIPFHVGEDRSRTWVLTRTATGIRLKHDHRHEDGSEDEVTQYGGDTEQAGSSARQEFPADSFTATLIPAAANNIWAMEVEPGKAFAYELRRRDQPGRFRAEFDLTKSVPVLPAPWGSKD
jgi:hypothetical protein